MGNDKSGKKTALVVATSAASLVGLGPLGAALNLAATAASSIRERRVKKMWEHVVSGKDDPVAFTEWVAARVLQEGDAVGDAFIGAAQTAADAVAPVAIASIGLLARLSITEQRPSRRLYRAVLSIFRSLDDEEYAALRRAAHLLVKVGDDASTILHYPNPTGPIEWWCRSEPKAVLASGPVASVLVNVLAPVLEDVPLVERIHQPNLRTTPHIPIVLTRLLAETMPLPDDAQE